MKFIFYLVSLFICTTLAAQSTLNLIPNPSFEDINICHKYNEPCSPKAWRSVVLKNIRYIAHETDQRHFFPAADGARCIAFGVFNERKKQDRSFVQVPLLEKLEAGRKYKLSFALRPEQVMIGTIGVYFADTLQIYEKAAELLAIEPQLELEFNQKLVPATWVAVTAVYTATGGEQGMIIGNFKSDKDTKATLIGKYSKKHFSRRVYYAFDNFALRPLERQKTVSDIAVNKNFIYQDSFRHSNRYGIPLVSMVTTADSLNFYRRPVRPPSPAKPTTVRIAETEIAVNEAFVASAIKFTSNSDQLLPSAYPTLEVVADFLLANEIFKLKIIGHTDDVGTPFLNQKLAEDRARAVVRFMVERGVAPQRLVASGRGETEPIADNTNEYGREQNRRVEFVFY